MDEKTPLQSMFGPCMALGFLFWVPLFTLQPVPALVFSGLCLAAPMLWLAVSLYVSLFIGD